MNARSTLVVALFGAFAASTAGAAAAPRYHLADIGLPGQDCQAQAIGSTGMVVGSCTTDGGATQQGFLYRDGVTQALGEPGAGLVPHGVNGAGTAAGFLVVDARQSQAAIQPLGGAAIGFAGLGGQASSLVAIDDAGVAAGYAWRPDGTVHATRWRDGEPTDLGTLGGTYSEAYALNGNGEVAGESTVADGSGWHAFVFAGGQMNDLGTLGGRYSGAADINAKRHTVGYSTITLNGSVRHAFFHDGVTMRDLGRMGGIASYAQGLNDRDDIVGYVVTSVGHGQRTTTGFLVSDGKRYEIDPLLDGSGQGWHVAWANRIDDAGRIVGIALDAAGVQHACLLTPVAL